MKKSAIYLGAAACILAIAGAFTTKGSTKVFRFTGATINGHVYTTSCSNQGNNTCKTLNGQGVVYTDATASNKVKTSSN